MNVIICFLLGMAIAMHGRRKGQSFWRIQITAIAASAAYGITCLLLT